MSRQTIAVPQAGAARIPSPGTAAAVSRRRFLWGLSATAGIGLVGLSAGPAVADSLPGAPAPGHGHPTIDRSLFCYTQGSGTFASSAGAGTPVVRKSASAMSRQEIDRFSRAYTWAVAHGYLDVFSDEHFDHDRHRQHSADVESSSPPSAAAGKSAAWGHRLLPWHRSFLIEAERMLQAALHDCNRSERRDPAEARQLFLPYWDAAHDQGLPRWVERLKPRGATAIVPPGLPRGHAGYGKPVGSRYRIDFNRWPGTFMVFDNLPPVEQVQRILAHGDWAGFYSSLDVVPELIPANLPAAGQALTALAQKLPGDPYLQLILASFDPSYPKDPASQLAVFNAFLAVGHKANVEAARRRPDAELIQLILTVFAAARFPPHLVLHFWAAGLDPRNPHVRGTVSYFNELAADPVFWMLHGELDRWWYTWQQTHTEQPPLDDPDDRLFNPLTPEEGAWYGGGHTYTLDQLTDLPSLPYSYDKLFQ